MPQTVRSPGSAGTPHTALLYHFMNVTVVLKLHGSSILSSPASHGVPSGAVGSGIALQAGRSRVR